MCKLLLDVALYICDNIHVKVLIVLRYNKLFIASSPYNHELQFNYNFTYLSLDELTSMSTL